MSTTHHSPIATGAAANAATINSPLGQLDAALLAEAATRLSGDNSLQQQIDQIVLVDGDSSAEVLNARLGVNTSDDGTGIVLRDSVEWAAGNTYNVRAYEATGDGVTDDTAAIQDAMDAIGVAGGGTLFVPPGTYLIDPDTPLTPPVQYRYLDCEGRHPEGEGHQQRHERGLAYRGCVERAGRRRRYHH